MWHGLPNKELATEHALELFRGQLQALRVGVVDGLGAPFEQVRRPQKEGGGEVRGRSLALSVVSKQVLRNAQESLLQHTHEPRLHLWNPAGTPPSCCAFSSCHGMDRVA